MDDKTGAVTGEELVVDVQNVSKVYGEGDLAVQALRGVSLQVRTGELVAVMGMSGSGKSTLLQLAGGMDIPTVGDVVIEGIAVRGLSAKQLAKVRLAHSGFVFQRLNLVSSLTAIENVSLPLELAGVSAQAARAQAADQLGEVGLAAMANRFPEELSGGQQQRIAIARALVGSRRLILADEPTGALDSVSGDAVLRLLRNKVDQGAAGLLVTHESRHAAWADRVVYLRDGLVVDDVDGSLTLATNAWATS